MPRKKVDAVDTLDKEKETSLPQATEQEAKGPAIETAAGTVKTSGRSEGAGIAKGKPAEPSFFDVDYNELDKRPVPRPVKGMDGNIRVLSFKNASYRNHHRSGLLQVGHHRPGY